MGNIKNENRGFEIIPRDLVFDSSLSDRARFVYIYMASKPEGWDFFLEPMAKEIGYSVDTLRKYINELNESGWIEKKKQKLTGNKQFSSTEYIIKATKISDTENFRHGKSSTQENKDKEENVDSFKKENERDKSLSKSDEDSLFEDCWKAYNRKGSKAKAKDIWRKMDEKEKSSVLQHIKAYVSSREKQYTKDFERYLKDKTYTTIVVKGNTVVFDPTRETSNEYRPELGYDIWWNEGLNSFIFVGQILNGITDGYTAENRPDGAHLILNNSLRELTWSKEQKRWIDKKEIPF